MPTAGELVTRALGLLGVLEATETPTAADMQLGLTSLNRMVDDWGLQRQTLAEIRRSVYGLTAGQSSYTIGPGGNFSQVVPTWIERVSVIEDRTVAAPVETPLGTPLTVAEYQAIPDKTATSTFPISIYFDRGLTTAGLSTITVYPVPTSSAAGLVLYWPVPFTAFSDTTTDVILARGHARALETNLALELSPFYNIDPPAVVVKLARESLANIKRANVRLVDAGFDPALTGVGARYDITSDT